MNNEFSTDAAAGDTPGSQQSSSASGARRRSFRRLWRRSAAGATVAAASLAVLTVGVSAAHADTLPNGPTVQLGQYSIPSTPAAGIPGGDALPRNLGTLGNPTQISMQGGASRVLDVQGGSSAWGAPVETEPAPASLTAAETWRFQLVGYIAATTPAPESPLRMPVYKIINYHSDGTHTCLDGFGGNPTAGTMIDSYGCDANQVNQTNQLWIIGNTQQTEPKWSGGQGYWAWLSTKLQPDPSVWPTNSNSVIENVATLQANGWDTDKTPVLSASATLQVQLQNQNAPQVSTPNSTWLVHDTTPPSGS